MRSLHVAALPYPAPRGTQAALDAMLRALNEAGHPASLFCYPDIAAQPHSSLPYRVHRVARIRGPGTLKSGPSFAKLGVDVALAVQLARVVQQEKPELVVAHHVEAALCCLRLACPVLFIAHTSLRTELPTYFPASLGLPLARAGEALDGFLCRRYPGALAVSPMLGAQLSAESGAQVGAIALPWPVPEPISASEREAARGRVGLHEAQSVLLYAGNLDAYQGVEALLEPLSRLVRAGENIRWLVASDERPRSDFVGKLADFRLSDSTHFVGLSDESSRRLVHAAADMVLVPRRAAGGLPIKLLEALARGIPVVATARACAGLELASCVEVVSGNADSWCAGIERMRSRPRLSAQAAGRAYIADVHNPRRFAEAFVAHAARKWGSQG